MEKNALLVSRSRSIRLPVMIDMLILAGLTLVCNLHLLTGANPDALIFLPGRVAAGEWWRILIHPFVHVSWYHLALDAGGFFLLYSALQHLNLICRMLCLVFALTGSITGTLLASGPTAALTGLCGLSGVAHGLMAIGGLVQVREAQSRSERIVGWGAFISVVVKSLAELITGRLFLDFLHFGDIGIPLVACHIGGVSGGIMAWILLRMVRGIRPTNTSAFSTGHTFRPTGCVVHTIL
jgi:rhomboid family GlyGly-CTERM serine protease